MDSFFSTYWLDILGTMIGFVYIYQEYKAQIGLWITGIIMPVVYMFVYINAGLYADFAMQVYYAVAAIYGFIEWYLRKTPEAIEEGGEVTTIEKELPITHYPKRTLYYSLLTFLVMWGVIYLLLIKFTNSTVPVADSFGNALSFIGLWALSRKYIEQWWIWMVVDTELSILYFYKGIPFTSGLYAAYVVICFFGYIKWKKMMQEQ